MTRFGIALAAMIVWTAAAQAQSNRRPAEANGTTRALVVFVRFADDTTSGTGCRADRGWPLTVDGSLEPLPGYASTLFSTSSTPPFADSTVTAYFFEQSGGRFTLIADVYPEVVVSDEPTSSYHRAVDSGYGYLTDEIVRKIDPNVDFTHYDTNPVDGVVDHMIIVVRRDDAGTFTGVADLRGADLVFGAPASAPTADGIKIDWSSGSFIYNERPGHIISQSYMVRMVAHEFGHHLWNPRRVFANHIPAIRSNDTPINDTNTIGYVLMAGRGGGRDARGDLLISPPEREALGWLNPIILDPAVDSMQAIDIGDLYTDGASVRVDLQAVGDYRASLYLANRQRMSWFDSYRLDAPPDCTPYEMGLLRTTGMVAYLSEWRGAELTLDVLPADNTLELSTVNGDYFGDLFSTATSTQITPFTTPSTSLPTGEPSWVAIDDIGMTGRADSSMRFTFIPDFRRNAVVRAPSTIRPEMGEVKIFGDLLIKDGGTLTLESDAHVEVTGSVVIEEGAQVVVRDRARLVEGGWARFFFAPDTLVSVRYTN